MNKSEELIACLEGEIAKRDEELAACRVAVENCDMFRARIAEMQERFDSSAHRTSLIGRLEIENAQLSAELSALKAQEPVAWAGAIEYGVPMLMVEPQNWKATPLYAAPVSEAKAQGVVQWPDADEIMQMAFEEGQPADDASGYCFELEEFDLFIERLISEVARLNAAPVQQVSVPECYARLLKHAFGMTFGEDWNRGTSAETHRNKLIEAVFDCRHLLAAAPAAPAADAGLVEALDYQALFDAIAAATSVYANGAINISVQAFRDALAANRAKGVV